MEDQALSGGDDRFTDLIKSGLNLGNGTFWDDFISIAGNTNEMSELFGIAPEKLAEATAKIKNVVDQVKSEEKPSKKAKTVDPVVSPGDQTAEKSQSADLNPTP